MDEFALGERDEPEEWIPTLGRFTDEWRRLPDAVGITLPEILQLLEQQGLPMRLFATLPHRMVFKNA